MLDQVGETAHHLALCRGHHRLVDDYGEESGLMIDGYAYRDGPYLVYVGPDEYLTAEYGPERSVALQDLRQGFCSEQPARGSRAGVWS